MEDSDSETNKDGFDSLGNGFKAKDAGKSDNKGWFDL
jgi:hypothetical protein